MHLFPGTLGIIEFVSYPCQAANRRGRQNCTLKVLGGNMRPGNGQDGPDPILHKWRSLPLSEKRRQFRELVRSPYWHFLPEEIRERLRKLIFSKEESEN